MQSRSVAERFPKIAAQWHPTKNGDLTPDKVPSRSHTKVWWKCDMGPDHEWDATLVNRTTNGQGCPCCANQKVSVTNSLLTLYPQISAQLHPTKNRNLTPDNVIAGSHTKLWWKCDKDPEHVWEAQVGSRTSKSPSGCPFCNWGWTVENIRRFVSSIREHLPTFSPAELYVLFQQSGLLGSSGKSRAFIRALVTGRFPLEEVDKFANGDPSLVDEFIADSGKTLEQIELDDANIEDADEVINEENLTQEPELPVIETKDVLGSLTIPVVVSADEEAVNFLIASATWKIWKHAYLDEQAAVTQAKEFEGQEYAEEVRSKFLQEYEQARSFKIPGDYSFRIDGEVTPPNLMQLHFASRLGGERRIGNWSGTGAGKTLAAILATRAAANGLTVICCPNSVVKGWHDAILEAFPESIVECKSFRPVWLRADQPRYLILHYEAFQQPTSAEGVRDLAETEKIDFVIVDEIHYAKQRHVENISQRRKLVSALVTMAGERNPGLSVIGMSATPVINNLQEGKSMVELITGLSHDELNTQPTVSNCMKLHQKLVTLGIRWLPKYELEYEQVEIPVDCSDFLNEIRALGSRGTPLSLEQILTRARLPEIRRNIRPKTLIYTHYIDEIDRTLRDALIADGWKVGFFTGEDKSGLDAFIEGDLDVLIGTGAIATGVDRLQWVCNRLIVNVLPWTAAEFEQLKGRIYRQGQKHGKVTMILPLTFAEVNGQRWSWCESKMNRLRFKKSIADAAVDGVVPEGHLRSPAQAYQDQMAWLERLESGRLEVITRSKIVVPLPDADAIEVAHRIRRYGDFSVLNNQWNRSNSGKTHERLQANPEEWEQYHTLYRRQREQWTVIPYEEMIRWCQEREGYAIGDFGCGEAEIAAAVSARHTVYSFDHVAINEDVTASDMAHVPLEDEVLDVAVFSLSLMGSNFADYLREAHRTLKLDGHLHIIEATARFKDRAKFVKDLASFGFEIISVEDKWKFTHIRAMKNTRSTPESTDLHF